MIPEEKKCWLAAYTRSRHEDQVSRQLTIKGLESLLPMYISDCVEGLLRLMLSDYREPINLGTEELVSVNRLVDMVCEIAGKKLVKRHDVSQPQGVRGRNSDNSRLRAVLRWEPKTRLRDGLAMTYPWIERELEKAGRLAEKVTYATA